MSVPDRQSKPYTGQSEQGVLNESRDEKYKVIAVELTAENSTQDALVRLKTDASGALLTGGTGFTSNANITTTIAGNIITQTDGIKTLTTTISGSTITEVWT